MAAPAAASRMAAPDEEELGEALKHLSAEERARIVEVMQRAKRLDDDHAQRAKEIEKDYISFTANVLQKQASVDKHVPLCPICCQQILDPDRGRSSSSSSSSSAEVLNACNDCERVVCSACGSFETSMKTKLKEWLCHVCSKRRQFVISSGVWIGKPPTSQKRDAFQKRSISMGDYEVVLPCVSTSAKDGAQAPPPQPQQSPAVQEPAAKRPLRRTDSMPLELDSTKAAAQPGRRPNHLDLTPPDAAADGGGGSRLHQPPAAAPDGSAAKASPEQPARAHQPLHRLLMPSATMAAAAAEQAAPAANEATAAIDRVPAVQPRLRRSAGTDFAKDALGSSGATLTDGEAVVLGAAEVAGAATGRQATTTDSYEESDEDSENGMGNDDCEDEEVEEGEEEEEEEEYLTEARRALGGASRAASGSLPGAAACDWSPATDLSPIEDVSPTVELEAEADWLAYQTRAQYRQHRSFADFAAAAAAALEAASETNEAAAAEAAEAATVCSEINNNSVSLCSVKLVDSPTAAASSSSSTLPPPSTADGGGGAEQRRSPCLETQSTTESGYESQSMGRVSDLISYFDRKSLDESKTALDGCVGDGDDGGFGAADAAAVASAFGASAFRPSDAVAAANRNVYREVDAAVDVDYDVDYDRVPDVPDGVTFNIYAGRDMFRSSAADDHERRLRPTTAPTPPPPTVLDAAPRSSEAQRQRWDTRDSASPPTNAIDAASPARRVEAAATATHATSPPGAGLRDEQLHYSHHHQPQQRHVADRSSLFTHADVSFDDRQRGADFGDKQGSMPEAAGAEQKCQGKSECALPEAAAVALLRTSPTSPGGDISSRKPPVPLPRLSKLRSLDSDDSFSVAESDDELLAADARRLGGSGTAMAAPSGTVDASDKGRLFGARSSDAVESNRSPLTVRRGGGGKQQQLADDSDMLRQRSADKQEIALDLERQLVEIRRLEERQRAILQRTLMSVVRSAQESSQSAATAAAASAAPLPESLRAGCKSLAAPAAAGAASGGAMVGGQPRLSPQSPRKAGSRSGGGGGVSAPSGGGGVVVSSGVGGGARAEANFKFSPISENGDYSFRDWAGSPAALHRRTMSNHSLISDGGAPPPTPLTGSYSCLVRTSSDNLQQQQQFLLLQPRSDGETSRCRLSASYTELQQQQQQQNHYGSWSLSSSRDSPDRGSGYFSDRECERRKALPTPYAVAAGAHGAEGDTALQMAFLQNEIERRQRQLEENIRLRDELQQLCRLAVLPRDQYERARDLYRDHLTSAGGAHALGGGRGLREPAAAPPSSQSPRISSDRAAIATASSASAERLSGPAPAAYAASVAPSSRFGDQEARPPARNHPQAAASHGSLVSGDETDNERAVIRANAEVVEMPSMPLLNLRSPAAPRSRPTSTASDVSPKASSAGAEGPPLATDGSSGAPIGRSSAAAAAAAAAATALVAAAGTATAAQQQPPAGAATAPKVKKWNFATKRILVIPKQNKGPCIEIAGGLPVQCDERAPSTSEQVGAYVKNILSDSIESQLHGELKKGDEILEWNGVCLRDRSNDSVQDIISSFSSEIEMVVKESSPRRSTRSGRQRSPSGSETQAAQPPTIVATAKISEALATGTADSTVVTKAKLSGRRPGVVTTTVSLAARADGASPNVAATAAAAASPADSAPAASHVDDAPRAAAPVASGQAATKRQPAKAATKKGSPVTVGAAAVPTTASQPSATSAVAVGSSRSASAPATTDSPAAPSDKQLPRPSAPSASKVANGGAPGSGCTTGGTGVGGEHRAAASGDARRPLPAGGSLPATPLPDRRTLPLKKLIDCGELHAAFAYDQNRQLLTTRIESADGLAIVGKDAINPFVKIHFIRNEKIEEKRCTRYMEKTSCPAWKQSFTLGVAESELPHYKVRLSAWDYHLPKQNLFIGSAVAQLSDPAVLDGSLRTYKLDCGVAERRRAESAKSSPTATSPAAAASAAAGAAASHAPRTVRFTGDGASTASQRPQQQRPAAAAAGTPRSRE